MLNVDPELLAWGASVGDMFSQCAMIMSTGQSAAQNAASAIESPVGEASYSESGASFSDTAESRSNFRNAQQERRTAAQTERAKATEQVFAVISNASKDRAAVRVKMTEKYGVEF